MLRIHTSENPARRLTLLYLIALSAVALFTILGQVLVQVLIHRQETDSRVINIAGRQRMLSQRLAKAALEADTAQSDSARAAVAEELAEIIPRWHAAHLGLQAGDGTLNLPGGNSPEVAARFAALDVPYKAMRQSALALQAGLTAAPGPVAAGWTEEILRWEGEFLEGMDALVFLLEAEARARVERLASMEIALMFSTLFVLMVEGILIFRPAAEHIRDAFARRVLAEQQSARLASELQTLLDSTPALIWYQDHGGALQRINKTAAEVIGKSIPALLSNPMARWFPDSHHAMSEEDHRVGTTGARVRNTRRRMVTAVGEERWLEVNKAPCYGPDGRIEGIIASAEDITERVQMEEKLRDLRLDEQRRIGHDLHDGLGQVLTGVTLLSRGMEKRLVAAGSPEAKWAGEIGNLVGDGIRQVRAIAQGIRPIETGTSGLLDGLATLASRTTAQGDLECTFEADLAGEQIDDVTAEQVYRIAQEAVGNAVKHSGAANVQIRLTAAQGVLRLTVQDDGHGHLPADAASGKEHSGLGLRIMHHRAQLSGGQLQIHEATPQGVAVECELHLNNARKTPPRNEQEQ